MPTNSTVSPAIGFIGLGAIGKPMAERIVSGGMNVVVTDIRKTATVPFEGRATIAASPAEVAARSDIVIACLASLDAYRSIVTAPDGIQNSSRAKLYVHVGTTGPNIVRELETILQPKGISVLDAPMTGGIARASAGTLTTMVSGARQAADHADAALRCYSNKVVYLGEKAGAAQVMKLINNLLSAANLAVASESLLLGAKAGLDPETMLEVLNAGTGQNSATLVKIPLHVLTRKFDYGGAMHITIKDLKAYTDEAELQSFPTPIADKIRQIYVDSYANGSEDDDMTAVVQHMEKLAAFELPKTR